MLLSDNQQQQAKRLLGQLSTTELHEIENALTALNALGDRLKPYLNYLARSGQATDAVVRYAAQVRDAWAARILLYILEHGSHQKTAQQAWNHLRSMGKLPKEWRDTQFTPALWEKCRTKPAEIPAKTDEAWAVIVQWHLIFNFIDTDPTIHQEAQAELSYIGVSATLGLMGVFAQDDITLWQPALTLLRDIGDKRALDTLGNLQNHPDETIKNSATAAIMAIQARPDAPLPPRPTLNQSDYAPYRQPLANIPLSGKFDADLEQKIVQALGQITAPDPDDKKAGWQVLNTLANQAIPILRYYAQSDSSLRQSAQSVITTLNLK